MPENQSASVDAANPTVTPPAGDLNNLDSLAIPAETKPAWVEDKHYDPQNKQVRLGQIIKSRNELSSLLGKKVEDWSQSHREMFTKGNGEQAGNEAQSDQPAGLDSLIRKAGYTIEQLQEDIIKNGDLNEKQYKDIDIAGIPADIMKAYIEGQKAKAAQRRSELDQFAGGKERLDAALEWAAKNLPEEAFNQIKSEISDAGSPTWKVTLAGLLTQAGVAGNNRGIQLTGMTSVAASSKPVGFSSMAERNAAKADPRYWPTDKYGQPNPKYDPAYVKTINQRILATDLNAYPQV